MWEQYPVELKANTVKEYTVKSPRANMIYIVNNSSNTIYADLERVAADHYEGMSPGFGSAILVRNKPVKKVLLLSSGDSNIIIHEIAQEDPNIVVMLQSLQGQISINSTVGLKAGELNLDAQKNLQVNINTMPSVDLGEYTWKRVPASGTATGVQSVKAAPGKVAKITVESGTANLQDGANQAWAPGNQDFNNPLNCTTDIKVNITAAGAAWVLFK